MHLPQDGECWCHFFHIYIYAIFVSLSGSLAICVSRPHILSLLHRSRSLTLFLSLSLSLPVALPFSLSLSACLPLSLLSSNHWCHQRNSSQNQRHCRPRFLHFYPRLQLHCRHHSNIRCLHRLRPVRQSRCHYLNRKDYLVVRTLLRNFDV